METVKISLSKVKVDPAFNVRMIYEEEGNTIADLAANITANGLLNPPSVIPIGAANSGEYFLVVGFRRFKAMQSLKWTEGDFRVLLGVSKQQSYILNMVDNEAKKDLTAYERATRCAQLAEEFTMTHADIAARCYLSKSYVDSLLRIRKKVIKPVIDVWKNPSHPLYEFCTTDTLARLAGLDAKEQKVVFESWGKDEPIEDEGDTSDTDGDEQQARKAKLRKHAEVKEWLALARKLEEVAQSQHKLQATQIRETLEWVTMKRKGIQLITAYKGKLEA